MGVEVAPRTRTKVETVEEEPTAQIGIIINYYGDDEQSAVSQITNWMEGQRRRGGQDDYEFSEVTLLDFD
jgi:hypothetical protein